MLEFAKDNRDFRLRVAEPKIGRVRIGCLVTLFKYNFTDKLMQDFYIYIDLLEILANLRSNIKVC